MRTVRGREGTPGDNKGSSVSFPKVFTESSSVFHVTASKQLWMLAKFGSKKSSSLQIEVSRNVLGIGKIKAH